MKQRFQRVDPDVFDLAWLDDQELERLQRAMLSNSKNELCAYWLRSFNEQAAIRTGKLRIIPGTEARDPDFKQYSISELDAARLIFGGIENQLNAMGKSMGERFCKLLVECCSEAIERKQESSFSDPGISKDNLDLA
jgi:hypothetical protein